MTRRSRAHAILDNRWLRGALPASFALLLPGCPFSDDYFMAEPSKAEYRPGCGNGIVQTGEDCEPADLVGKTCADFDFPEGTLACTSSCQFDTSGCFALSPPSCGNRVADAGEACDNTDYRGVTCEDFVATGPIACTAQCELDTSGCVPNALCGNDRAEGSELCDGLDLRDSTCLTKGFSSGALSCSADCQLFITDRCVPFEPMPECGDGTVDDGEECDGGDLADGTCPSEGFSGGTLACGSDCQFDTSGCTGGAACDFDGGSRTGVILRADTSEQTSRVSDWNCADGGAGPDLSLTWTAPATGCYQVMLKSEEDLDTILGVFPNCQLLRTLACDDNGGLDQLSLLEFDATAGTSYALVVDSYFNTDSGPIQIDISPCAPAEWTCEPGTYGRDDGCDCGCGALDLDCDGDSSAAACLVCVSTGSCAEGRTCNAILPDENWSCSGPR